MAKFIGFLIWLIWSLVALTFGIAIYGAFGVIVAIIQSIVLAAIIATYFSKKKAAQS